MGHRSRATRPAMALWLLVLAADGAALGSPTRLGYVLAGIIALALVVVGAGAVVSQRDRMTPQPVRVRADSYARGRRDAGRR
jgi:hypothetical protein